MSDNIHSQYDFFQTVQLDADGNLLVSIVNPDTGSTANYYTTGATLIGDTVYFDRNDLLSAYTLSLSAFSTDNYYVTGGTFNKSTSELTLQRNDGGSVVVSGITDFYTTGATLSGTIVSFNRNDLANAYSIELSGITANYLPLSGGTIDGELNINGALSVTGFTTNHIVGGNATSSDSYIADAGGASTIAYELNLDGGFCGGAPAPSGNHQYKVHLINSAGDYTFTENINVASIGVLTSPMNVYLPTYPYQDFYIVKEKTGNAGIYPVTVSSSGNTINGETNFIINLNTKPSITFLWDGDGWITI